MPANTSPIFTLTPNVGRAAITTTYAQVKSDGTSAGSSNDRMVKAFTAGSNGSFVERVRFSVVATAATNSVATTLRCYLSTVADPSTTATVGGSDTHLLGEVSVPIIAAASTTVATAQYDIVLNVCIPSGTYIHVSQAIAQTTNQSWQAVVYGGDY